MAKPKNCPPPKKCAEQECEEGLPPWLATFADLATNMLCFFVLLLSFAQMDVQKFKDMIGSIKEAFGVQTRRPDAPYSAFSPSKLERKEVKMTQDDRAMLGMVVQLNTLLDDDDLKKSTKVTTDDVGVIMRVDNDALFEPGTATLKPGADKALAKVIAILKEHNYDLVVRGHTDDRPTSNNLYPSNWELSSARAATALRSIIEKGDIRSSRLKAVGYADSQPLLPNNSDENRQTNRRTEFFFHRPGDRSW
ncbi:OmpA family protein [Megalodesulfovibrio gigas]|uniref:Putative OmpA/MotB domain-containing protein n=1 Tax=Megalodesulfovibrio gigas (strain ATCC 19364 / DSM 1382 / NCIMB 9332 / VKM B-1759) TaxID=1121448 RepID=T2G775_MEGG1|nr:OmpA family protein [Megalodesulfovibrio gigas]AGW12044.1 putative OmpA/MotB domain-containing protein [Megalodesulfovibrio gigas DSM 1382 = ATCC 19364]